MDWRAGFFGVEAAGELGVRSKKRWAAVELTGVGEDHSCSTVHGLNHSADLHVHVAVFAEFADFVVIVPGTDDRELAVVVRGLG